MRPLAALLPAVLILPIAAGLWGTLRLAGAGGVAALHDWPGLWRSSALTLTTAFGATFGALAIAGLILAVLPGRPAMAALTRALSPLIALPHAAAALGLAFLIAPSGWIARALSPWATGWSVPPDLALVGDPAGLALMLGLTAKELPFLLIMGLAALPACQAPERLMQAQLLGHGRLWAFALTVWPALYARLRLPVLAVLAYGLTNADMAAILGPTRTPTLAVAITRAMTGAGLDARPRAAALALWLLVLAALVLALWRGAEALGARARPGLAMAGPRGAGLDAPARALALTGGFGLAGLLAAAILGLALWSVAGPWPFPMALPRTLSLDAWTRAGTALGATTLTTALIALAATLPALALTLIHAQGADRHGRAEAALYLPLLIPQIAFLPGLADLAFRLGLQGHAAAVAALHLIFVAPYLALSLTPAFRSWDSRQALVAASLGAGPLRIFLAVKLPQLLAPILTATALGLAVSEAQYLPTLLIGGGRVETLTTEAVALASGGDRRLAGAYGLAQVLLPAAGFALALAIPALVFANRRALRPGGLP